MDSPFLGAWSEPGAGSLQPHSSERSGKSIATIGVRRDIDYLLSLLAGYGVFTP